MTYIFTHENRKALEELSFHDWVYEGFSYDYPSREIRFGLTRPGEKTRYQLRFENVVALEMQGCGFWGCGNGVYHLWIDEDPAYFRRMEELQARNPENFRLDEDIRFLSVIMQLSSGDELKITCQTLEADEQSL